MKQGAVIVTVWLALAAPSFSQESGYIDVSAPQLSLAAATVSIPYAIRIWNQTGALNYYVLEFGEDYHGLHPSSYRAIGLPGTRLEFSATSPGYSAFISTSRGLVSFLGLTSDSTVEHGPFDEVRIATVVISAVTGGSSRNGRRIIYAKRWVVRIHGSRDSGASVLPFTLDGDYLNDVIFDSGQSLEMVHYNVGNGFAKFFWPASGMWSANEIMVTGRGVFLAPSGVNITALGGTAGTWVAGDPGVWDVPGDDGGSGPALDFSPAVEAVETLHYVLFGCSAAVVVALGLKRLWTI